MKRWRTSPRFLSTTERPALEPVTLAAALHGYIRDKCAKRIIKESAWSEEFIKVYTSLHLGQDDREVWGFKGSHARSLKLIEWTNLPVTSQRGKEDHSG